MAGGAATPSPSLHPPRISERAPRPEPRPFGLAGGPQSACWLQYTRNAGYKEWIFSVESQIRFGVFNKPVRRSSSGADLLLFSRIRKFQIQGLDFSCNNLLTKEQGVVSEASFFRASHFVELCLSCWNCGSSHWALFLAHFGASCCCHRCTRQARLSQKFMSQESWSLCECDD